MTRYHAAWVLPIAGRPIRDGWVAVADGRITGCGPDGTAPQAGAVVDLGEVAILPGLVNAHTHLELSYLAGQVEPAAAFIDWIRDVVAVRRQQSDPAAPSVLHAMDDAVAGCLASGTALVGDISNTLVSVPALGRSRLGGVVFYELIRFNTPDAPGIVAEARRAIDALTPSPDVRVGLAAHAPYSVSPRLFEAIRRDLEAHPSAIASVHLAESPAESEFISAGTGPWRQFLEAVGAWDPVWRAAGVSPVEYVARSGFVDRRILAVHGVQMDGRDLARLARAGATLVSCPRSNQRTGAGVPPVAAFYEAGVRVAVGTDSLASTPDLNVFAEMAEMRRLARDVPAAALLESATRQGARALGFSEAFGSIEAGKRARLIAVDISGASGDVEEYLVSGIHPGQIRWLDEQA